MKQETNTIVVRIKRKQYDQLLKESLKLSLKTGKSIAFSVYLQSVLDAHLQKKVFKDD